MTELERKALRMYEANNKNVTDIKCRVRFKDMSAPFDTIVRIGEYDEDNIPSDDDEILYYFKDFNNFISTLANIDELDRVDDQEEHAYQQGTKDFVITDVYDMY